MAGFELRLIPVALAALLVQGGCNARFAKPGRSSVTVKLPPARSATPRPAFSLERGLKQS
jgi:hypothetical protein